MYGMQDFTMSLARLVDFRLQVYVSFTVAMKLSEKVMASNGKHYIMQETRRAYSKDLSDAEWTHLAPNVSPSKPGGRPPKHTRCELVNAIFYLIRSGKHSDCCP
jgi:hypothetical protein